MASTSDPGPYVRREHPIIRVCVEEKLRLTRTLRALDRAGVDPSSLTAVQRHLVELGRFDGLLTAVLEFAERTDEDIEGLRDTIEEARLTGESLRGEILDSLPPPFKEAFREACSDVTAAEFEVWNEVDSFRMRVARADETPPDAAMDPDEMAAMLWGDLDGDPADLRLDPRVRRHETKPLPPPDAPLRAFFDRAPRPWRAVMAQFHDMSPRGRPALAQRLADRLADPAWMRRFLAERLGRSEREILLRLVLAGREHLDADDPDDAYFVHWDWQERLPPSSGGKLRAAGLVHVARAEGLRFAIVPPALVDLLADALPEVDPRLARDMRRALKRAQAEETMARPPEDLDHRRWHALDERATALISEALSEHRDVFRSAASDVTGGRMTFEMTESQLIQLFEFAGFIWRSAPTSPTLAERVALDLERGEGDEELDAEARAHFGAVAAAPPAVYRVVSTDGAQTLQLERVFPPGPPEVITDRALAMTAELGFLLGARTYDAGPYRLIRLFGGPVEEERQKRFLRALRRERKASGAPDGIEGDVAFLRNEATAVMRLFAEFSVPGS